VCKFLYGSEGYIRCIWNTIKISWTLNVWCLILNNNFIQIHNTLLEVEEMEAQTPLPSMCFIILSTWRKARTVASKEARLLSASGHYEHCPICEASDNYTDLSCGRFSSISDMSQPLLSNHLLLKGLKSTECWNIMQAPVHRVTWIPSLTSRVHTNVWFLTQITFMLVSKTPYGPPMIWIYTEDN
jgi:hypothetical protein